jgi:hypothetical protein
MVVMPVVDDNDNNDHDDTMVSQVMITYSSVRRAAPSKAFSSIPVTLFRLRSSFCRFGSLPNKPSDLMRPISLSFSKLKQKEK